MTVVNRSKQKSDVLNLVPFFVSYQISHEGNSTEIHRDETEIYYKGTNASVSFMKSKNQSAGSHQ